MIVNKHEFKNSSSIDWCDYDDEKNLMIIKFTSGATYHYPDCHKMNYEALKAAASPGKHFHQNIRKFKAIKID